MDAPWIGKAVGVVALLGIATLVWLSHWLEKRGMLKNYSRGLGRGLLEFDAMLRPSKQHVQQAKEGKLKLHDDQGDGGSPAR